MGVTDVIFLSCLGGIMFVVCLSLSTLNYLELLSNRVTFDGPAVQCHLIQTFIVFGGWEVEVSLRAAVISSSRAGESSRALI